MAGMNRRLRASAALLAIAAMLFAPIAMALHACPSPGDRVAAAAAMAAMSSAGDDGSAPMDMAPCERHCTQASATFDLAQPPATVAAPQVAPIRVPALEPVAIGAPAFDSPFAFAAGPAPPLLRYTVLRI